MEDVPYRLGGMFTPILESQEMAQGQFSANHFGNANLSNEQFGEKCLKLDLHQFAISLGLTSRKDNSRGEAKGRS